MWTCDLAPSGNVSRFAFHNLTNYCKDDTISSFLGYPSTFFIQLVRVSLSICAIILLLALYNFVSVMNRHILSTATCSIYWIVMCFMITLKSLTLMVFPVLAWHINSTSSTTTTTRQLTASEQDFVIPDVQQDAGSSSHAEHFNMAGFILQAVLQAAIAFLLFAALDHERQFRSSDFATVEKPAKYCVAMSWRLNVLCSWPRLIALALSILPLILLVIIEVLYHVKEHVPQPLLWVYIASLPLTRLACLVVGVVLAWKKCNRLTPTVTAKILLILGLVFSLMEDFPNFVTTCTGPHPCQMERLTVFDLLQLVGITSLLFFVFFVRSQYLRVEQESKLNLVWDLQKLLQVNGRKDIVRHYT